MSVEKGFNTEKIYVRLLGEGTTVFRPSDAVFIGPRVAKLIAPYDYDADDENWEFKPGSIVMFETRNLEGKDVKFAVSLAA